MMLAAESRSSSTSAVLRAVIRRIEDESDGAAAGSERSDDAHGPVSSQTTTARDDASMMGGYETMLDSIQVVAAAAAGAHIHHGTMLLAACRPGERSDGRRLLLAGLGPIGTVVRDSARRNMLGMRFVDPVSSVARSVLVPVGILRSTESIYSEALASPETICNLSADTEQSIATRSARRAVLSILLNWPTTVPLTTEALGGPGPMVCLTRFIAASEHALEKSSAIFSGDDDDASSDSGQSSLLFVVESTLRRLIASERTSGVVAKLHRDSRHLRSAAALLQAPQRTSRLRGS